MYDESQSINAHVEDSTELEIIRDLLAFYESAEQGIRPRDPIDKASIASVRATLTMRANQLRERIPEDLQS